MWKHFGILLFGLASVSAAVDPSLLHSILSSPEAKDTISQLISQNVVNQMKRTVIRPSSSILPAFADPAPLDDAFITLPNDLGAISACHSSAIGASQITDFFDLSIGFPKAGASFMLGIPSLRIEGQHEAVIRLHRFLKITSHEDYSVELTNGRVDAEFQLRISIDGYIDVTSVSSYINFEGLKISTGGTYLNKSPIDIEGISSYLPALWSALWPELKPVIDTKVQEIANEVLKYCNVFTFIEGDYSCLEFRTQAMADTLIEESRQAISAPVGICPPRPPPPPPSKPDLSYFITSEAVTNYGPWAKDAERCPDGLFVTGFQLKTEKEQGFFQDDTALNAIRFYCGNTEQSVTSIEGEWGNWGKTYSCSNGAYANGFQLRSESDGALDNTAANNLRIFCSDNSNYIEGDGLDFGSWRKEFKCDAGFAICGIKTQVQPDQSPLNDDTTLNNLAALCCELP